MCASLVAYLVTRFLMRSRKKPTRAAPRLPIHYRLPADPLATRLIRMLEQGSLQLRGGVSCESATQGLMNARVVENGVGEWVDSFLTRPSRERLLALLRQEQYRARHDTKVVELQGQAHAELSAYAYRHQLTISAAVAKLLGLPGASDTDDHRAAD